MKTSILNFKIIRAYVLLIGLCCFFATSLNAQSLTYYKDLQGNITGTSDSRLVASMEETDENVTIKVFGIGQMRFQGVDYAFFLNEDVFELTDKTFSLTVPYGRAINSPTLDALFKQAIDVNPALKDQGGLGVNYSVTTGVNYRKAGAVNSLDFSSLEGFDALFVSINNAPSNLVILEIEAGAMIHLFTVYFNKKTPNIPIQKSDFGIGAKTSVPGAFSPRWEGNTHPIYYKYTTPGGYWHAVPELFYFRSASSVKTENATSVAITTATLNGEFKRGVLLPATDLLDGSESFVGTKTGRLDWDNISRRGFFYSTSAVDLEADEFSDSLFINGVKYVFPSDTEMTAGTFTRGSYTFYIKSAINADPAQTVTYSESLIGLTGSTQYYAWAFTKATFQTSNPFPNIGERVTFTTNPACVKPTYPIAVANQSFCPGAKVSDLVASVAPGTTLGWFETNISTTALSPTVELTHNTHYFARAIDGDCISDPTDVTAIVKQLSTASMITITAPQTSICSGETATLTASASGVTGPVFKWYASETSTVALETAPSYITPPLTNNTTYWVSVSNSNNYCEGEASSTGRKSITITVKPYSSPDNVTVTGDLSICYGKPATLTAAATGVTSPSYKWYSTATGGTPFHLTASYTTGSLTADATFYVSVSGDNYCEGNVRDTVKVTIGCNTVRGTVFPLVFIGDKNIDTLFTITAKLYELPPAGTADPIAHLRRVLPVDETTAVYYNGSVHVPGTPKNPGYSGSLINPGDSINWGIINKPIDPGMTKDTITVRPNEEPTNPIGLYSFSEVALGEYVLVLSRPGFIPRYTKIAVGSNGIQFIKHRELIGGDVNNDMKIDVLDINAINYRLGYDYGDSNYDARYDINGNAAIEIGDISLVKSFQGFHIEGYHDTSEWIKEYQE